MVCDKVPKLIEFSSFKGDYDEYENKVYDIYMNTFGNNIFYFKGKRIMEKKLPLYKNNKSGTFWHIISKGENESTRTPDFNRCARVSWPAFLLRHCCHECDKILIWENKRRNKTRTLLWCKDINYLVVLDNRKDFYLFWTAYPVTRKHTIQKLQKEYETYIKNKKKI